MTNNIKYSIIIPHKNIPNLLYRCLTSIPNCEELQIIIVDDNSDPNIVDFENFPGSNKLNTEIYFTKNGKGAGFARNIGLKYAKGKWLIFADSDDFFNDCFKPTINQYFNSKADIIYFSATSVNSDTLTQEYRHLKTETTIRNYNLHNEDTITEIKYANWEPWARMFNRDFIKNNNILFDEVMVGNDAGFVLKAGYYSRYIEVNTNPIYCVTFRESSLSYEVNETAFNNQYKATLLVNNYLMKLGRKTLSIGPHILEGRKYGFIKMIKMIFLARNYIIHKMKVKLKNQLFKTLKNQY